MKIKPIVLTIIILSILGTAIFYFKNQPTGMADIDNGSPITLYFRADCPHCRLVEKFLAENNVGAKISCNQKEISAKKQQNSRELMDKASICGISQEKLGVPFLWDNDSQKCYTGDVDIIEFFKNKL